MRIEWIDGFRIQVSVENGEAVLSGNKEGLFSLGLQLIALAEEAPGSHLHLDAWNSLEEGSAELILEKTE